MSPSVDRSQHVDTVIVGSGPSSLILSYLLHGNIPYYNADAPHPDAILRKHLQRNSCLLELDVPKLTKHFGASRYSYSSQALPVNTCLDTLIRPLADIDPGAYPSSVQWSKDCSRVISHLVIGNTARPGGQWADNPVSASWNIGSLSYTEQLSLPGYSLEAYLGTEKDASTIDRPTRRQIAGYLAAYPAAVGIEDSIRSGSPVNGVSRTTRGFYVASHDIHCKHLVLASGIFSTLIAARPELGPLLSLQPQPTNPDLPLLVVGSGFSAADVIITNLPRRKIIHIFKWQLDDHPSPLQACHHQAYPEYAGIYRQMKTAAMKQFKKDDLFSPMPAKKKRARRRSGEVEGFFDGYESETSYEGMPNTWIKACEVRDGVGVVELQLPDGEVVERQVGELAYLVGRRGALDYLNEDLRKEVIPEGSDCDQPISGRSLRNKTEQDIEVAPNVFAIGSLTGDSLIRFAYGSCVQTAGRIMADLERGKDRRGIEEANVPVNGTLASKRSSREMEGIDDRLGKASRQQRQRSGCDIS